MKAALKPSVAVLTILVFAITLDAETLSVDCRKAIQKSTEFPTITTAIARIAQKAAHEALGPNAIVVTGPCVENVSIVSLDNLTLQASPAGASISDASNGTLDTLFVGDSNRFALIGFTINGDVNCGNNSVCRLYATPYRIRMAGD